jgi:large subunit ribosomal protein L18e
MKLLVQLYRFLARRIASPFPKTILKRLLLTRSNRPPMPLSQVAKLLQEDKNKAKIAVVVSTVTNDEKLLEVPKIKLCALKISNKARERIIAAGGSVMTLDELAKKDPLGASSILLRGANNRKELKHFGKAPGVPNGGAAPLCRIKRGRKAERLKRRK